MVSLWKVNNSSILRIEASLIKILVEFDLITSCNYCQRTMIQIDALVGEVPTKHSLLQYSQFVIDINVDPPVLVKSIEHLF